MAISALDGAQLHSDGSHRCDLEYCQRCGLAFTTAQQGYWIERHDVDGDGENDRLFREDVEACGNKWLGFEEEDIGAWCDSCSWVLQRKRQRIRLGDGQ